MRGRVEVDDHQCSSRPKHPHRLLDPRLDQQTARARVILGGNSSLALGVTPTPSNATVTTGGTIPAATYNVICVALTLAAFREATIAGGVPVTGNRTNADGSVDSIAGGYAGKSAAASQVTTGATSVINSTVTAVSAPLPPLKPK